MGSPNLNSIAWVMGTMAREVNVQTTIFTQTSLQGKKPEEPLLVFNAKRPPLGWSSVFATLKALFIARERGEQARVGKQPGQLCEPHFQGLP
jgi:hypothetical protein